MKFNVNICITALLALVLPLTAAQDSSAAALVGSLPSCAIRCLSTAITASPCALTNTTCVCTNAPLQINVAHCVGANCTIREALFTKNVTQTLCLAPVRDRGPEYVTISIVLGVISGFFVVTRLGYKLVAKMDWALDDWFILITILAGVPSSVLAVHGTVANGLGKDIWTLSHDKITNFGKFFYIMEVLYFAQVTLLKMSLLFFYLRIFPTNPVRRILWITMGVNCLFGLFFVFLAAFQCQPISYFWDKWDPTYPGTCLNINAIGWSNAAVSIALDFWMIAIPLSQLRALNLHWKKKIGVGLMFCVGTFVTVVSILRLHSLVGFANSQNPTWDNFDVSNWSTIEINIGIICTCLPSLRLLLVRIIPQLGSTARKYAYYGNNMSGGAKSSSRSQTDRSRSRTLDNASATPQFNRPGGKAIVYEQSYSVKFSDHDEASLVQMNDFDLKSMRSKAGSKTSV